VNSPASLNHLPRAGEKARPHRGFFLGSNRVRTSPTWSASRVQPSPLSHVGPSSAVHAAAAMLGLVVVEAGCVAGGLAPCLLRTPTRHPSYGRQ
jgi:hypothetical protein